MEFVTLGKTGLRVSSLGFGGIPIQKITTEETRALFDVLEAQGINYVDSARGYTVSEALIGEAIEGRREKFILATKSMSRTKEAMQADIETSLKNFRTDHIDLYQMHNLPIKDAAAACGAGGALEALLEAKAAGKILHIGVTAHAIETFRWAVEQDFIETIMFPYNIVETQGEDLIARCKEKNIAFIAMKPVAGGAISDTRLAMRFLHSNENLTIAIPGMYCEREVLQNAEAWEDRSPLTPEELARMEAIRRELGQNFCRRCNYCAPCTVGIQIPNVFTFAGYLERYGLENWARERYASLTVKADACVSCGACETRCPYNLPIRQMLKDAAEKFGK